MTGDRPVVVGLGTVDPDLVTGVLGDGDRVRRRARPTPTWPSRTARSSAPTRWSTPRSSTAHRGCACSPAPGSAPTWSTSRRPPPAASPVVVTPGSGTRAVAEGVLAHTLALVKRCAADRADPARAGGRERTAGGPTGDLDGATIGIIGYGRIGRRVGELAAAFGMRVLAYDPFAPPPAEVACTDLDELVAASDVLTLHVPLTRRTTTWSTPRSWRDQARGRPDQLRSRRAARPRRRPRRAGVRAARRRRPRRVRARAPCSPPDLRPPDVSLTPHLMGLTRRATAATFADAAQGVVDVLAGRRPPRWPTRTGWTRTRPMPAADPAVIQRLEEQHAPRIEEVRST